MRDGPIIAIVGGAVAGSEAAALVAESGGHAVVFERGARPYGKIEEGLPRWHEKLRDKERARIDANLAHDHVSFVPETALGEDVSLDEILEWGFSAVLLANGAWRDRPLPVPGIDAFIGRGFEYQNAFVRRFNQHRLGPVPEGAVVVGGGLASIDVAKILSLKTHAAALSRAGHTVDALDLERRGIPAWCKVNGVDIPDVQRPTIVYRRRKIDMALVTIPDDADKAALAKAQKARVKIMDRVQERYLVELKELVSPMEVLVEDDRLVGLVCRRNEIVDGRVKGTDEQLTIRAPLTISSIGSTPEPIGGVPMKGELYDFSNRQRGAVRDHESVFGLGNVLTGRGNIRDSRLNAQHIASSLLGDTDGELADALHAAARAAAKPTVDEALALPAPDIAHRERIEQKIASRHKAIGYQDYASWMHSHPELKTT